MAKSGQKGAQNASGPPDRSNLSSARQRAIASAGSGLLAEPRRMKILEWLQEEGSARVRELSEAFGVSEPTIRQDLEKLETEGHIVREHGGAFLRSVPQQVRDMAVDDHGLRAIQPEAVARADSGGLDSLGPMLAALVQG